MKYNKLKSILTLLTVSFCLLATAGEVVNVRLCDETAPFLIGCDKFSTTGTYPVDVDGTTKTLNLIYGHSSPATELKDTIEAGQTYLFACQQLSGAAGAELTASETFTNVTGCDSVVNLKLKVKEACTPTSGTETATIKVGESYLFGCDVIEATEVGEITRTNTLVNAAGCDSIVTLTLTVEAACEPTEGTETATIKVGESYLFGCEVIEATEVGPITRTNTLVNAAGCDSTVTLTLTVEAACEPTTGTETATIKVGERYLFGCDVIEATEVGEITRENVLVNAAGCDSIITLTLTVNPNTVYTDTVANVCEGDMPYTWHGYVIDNDTVCSDTIDLTTYDSIVTLTLNVLRVQYAEVADSVICEGASCKWRDKTYGKEGIYYDTARYVGSDCDSMIYRLSVREAKVTYAPVEYAVSCDGNSYKWKGKEYIESGMYYDTARYVGCGCDSVIYTLDLTIKEEAFDVPQEDTTLCYGESIEWHGQTCNESKIYYDTVRYVSTQCDSAYFSINVTILPEVITIEADTTLCYGESIEWHDQTCNESKIYYDTVRYVSTQCDSAIYSIEVTILPDVINVPQEDITLCYGESIEWHGQTCDESKIYYDTVRYVGCECDSAIYTLNLTVNPAPTDSSLTVTICDGEPPFEWFGHKYSVAGIYYDTLYYTSGCDSIHGTLKLNVRKLTTEAPLLDTICAGEEYDWYGTKITEAGIYYDTIQYVGSACDSIARMLILTVNQPVTVEISETWCLAAARAEYPDLNITGTGDYTRVGTSALGCDSTTIYHITILGVPEVPALEDLVFQPVVACGFPIILDSARVAVAAELAMTQADDIAKVDHFWFEMQLTPTSEFKQITSDVIMSYTDEPIQIRLVLYTECDDVVYGEPVAYEVVKPSPEEIAEYGEMPAVSKYNNWLLMINVNKITEMGFDVKEEDVTWYQVINDIDPAGQHIDDKEVGKGFYFTADMSLTGQYYAVIETDKTEINECGAILRTLVVKCTTDGKMRLVPNTIHEGETMEVRNINPDENTTLWMYDRDGKLLEKHVTDGQEQYTIQPEQNAGVYLLRVVNGKQEESFKYVITK